MTRLTNKRLLAALVAVLAVAGVVWIYLEARQAKSMSDPAKARKQGKPIPVRTVALAEAETETVIGATAVTMPSETVEVRVGPSRQLSNTGISDVIVKAVHVVEGEYVKQGQLLVELEDELVRQILRQREAALAAAEADLKCARQQIPLNHQVRELAVTSADAALVFRTDELENRKVSLDAMTRLQESRSASPLEFYTARSLFAQGRYDLKVAGLALQKARNELQIGRLTDERDLAQALNNLEQARVNVEVAKREVEMVRIKSPIAGFVSKEELVAGQVVNINASMMQVVKLAPLHLKLDFPQERLGDVALGMRAEIALDGLPQESFTGTVVRMPARIDPELRVAPVIVEMANADHRIKAGLSGFVRLRSVRRTLTVPGVAVLRQGERSVVFRVEEGRARIREVQLGPVVQNGEQAVRQGLAAGDEVVVYPSNFYKHYGELSRTEAYLQDNDLVDADWRRWTRRD